MLINLRGTSGTGKSTIVREAMKRYDKVTPLTQDKVFPDRTDLKPRKQPLMYLCTRLDETPLAVLGHYETACGGCDTLPTYDLIFELVRRFDNQDYDVLFEGLLMSGDFPRTVELHKEGHDLLVIGLTEVPLDVCESSIRGRRAEKAATKGVEPREFGPNLRKNLESKYKLAKKTCDQLEAAGVRVVRADRALALETVIRELRLNR
jgi:hypothetical protein